VPLQDFLPTAEETGLIVPIGAFVLDQVAKQLNHWLVTLPDRSPSVSVNLSPRQFRDPNLLDLLADLLVRSKFPTGRLRLEITESVINQDAEASIALIRRLEELGLSVALDNFGSGLAAMNNFIRLPIDLVKVDRRLIAYLPVPGKQAAILQTIFDLGRLIQVRMLAEGIESKEQLEALRQYGCDLVQGHLFSPAVPQEKAQALLEKGRWRL
jgi:diguanylate cyclase